MDKITEVILSWQAVMLSFAAFAILGVVRNMGTKKIWEDGKLKILGGFAQNRFFKMFLPLYPYFLCGGLVFVPGIPTPEKLGTALGAKLLYAVWCGWFSDKVYQVIKSVLEKGFNMKFGVDKLEISVTPPVPVPEPAPDPEPAPEPDADDLTKPE